MPSPYDNESYMQSLLASEGDVKRQVDNAFGEIERRRNLAHTKLGEARTEQGRVFDYTNQDFGSSMGQMRGNLDRFGGLFRGLQAYDTSGFDRALGTQRNAYGEAMGLMGQGFDEQATHRQGAATSIRDQLINDIARQRSEYVSRREGEDRAAEEQRKAAEAQRLHEIELANIQAASMGGGGGGGIDFGSLFSLAQEPAPAPVGKVASGPRPKNLGAAPPAPSNVITDPAQIQQLLAANPSREQLSQALGVAPQSLFQLEDGAWMVQGATGFQPVLPPRAYGRGLGVLK